MALIPLRLRPILRVLPPAPAACCVEAVASTESRSAVPLFASSTIRLTASITTDSVWPIILIRIRQKESVKQNKLAAPRAPYERQVGRIAYARLLCAAWKIQIRPNHQPGVLQNAPTREASIFQSMAYFLSFLIRYCVMGIKMYYLCTIRAAAQCLMLPSGGHHRENHIQYPISNTQALQSINPF